MTGLVKICILFPPWPPPSPPNSPKKILKKKKHAEKPYTTQRIQTIQTHGRRAENVSGDFEALRERAAQRGRVHLSGAMGFLDGVLMVAGDDKMDENMKSSR